MSSLASIIFRAEICDVFSGCYFVMCFVTLQDLRELLDKKEEQMKKYKELQAAAKKNAKGKGKGKGGKKKKDTE